MKENRPLTEQQAFLTALEATGQLRGPDKHKRSFDAMAHGQGGGQGQSWLRREESGLQ